MNHKSTPINFRPTFSHQHFHTNIFRPTISGTARPLPLRSAQSCRDSKLRLLQQAMRCCTSSAASTRSECQLNLDQPARAKSATFPQTTVRAARAPPRFPRDRTAVRVRLSRLLLRCARAAAQTRIILVIAASIYPQLGPFKLFQIFHSAS